MSQFEQVRFLSSPKQITPFQCCEDSVFGLTPTACLRWLSHLTALNTVDAIAATGFSLIKRLIRSKKQVFAFLLISLE